MRNIQRRIVLIGILAFVVPGLLLALSLTTALSAPPINPLPTIKIIPKVTLIVKPPVLTLVPPKKTLIVTTLIKLPSKTPTTGGSAPTATNTPPVAPTNTPTTMATLPPPTATTVPPTKPPQALPTRTVPPPPPPTQVAACPSDSVAFHQLDPASGSTHILLYNIQSKQITDRTPGLDGTAQHPRFSPDNNYIIFTFTRKGETNTGLWVVPTCGGEPEPIIDAPDLNEQQPDWSVTNKIVLSLDKANLYVFDPIAGTTTDLGVAGAGPAFSPNGEWIVYADNGALFVVSAQGSASGLYNLKLRGTNPRWNPDGSGLTYYVPGIGLNRLDFATQQKTLIDPLVTDAAFDSKPGGQLAVIVNGQLSLTSLQAVATKNQITQPVGNTKVAGSPDWTKLTTSLAPDMSAARAFFTTLGQAQ
ncbi:MAG: PD40 domain-containing protein [Anaerolineae bacterium]|nr:PD40 domain-containing protein [Anaerolineae bacterium]